MKISILHISDLHRDRLNPIDNHVLFDSLVRDFERYTSSEDPLISAPNFIIVTGDLIQGVLHGVRDGENKLRHQYKEAETFLNELTERFVGGDKSRIVIVPGNHDVSDETFRQSLAPVNMAEGVDQEIVQQLFRSGSSMRWSWNELALYEIKDAELYKQRFNAFIEFYHNFYGGERHYSSESSEQYDVFDCPNLGICVVGFNSCYNNDLLNRQGAIHPNCVAEANTKLRKISISYEPLRIAVWHHNTDGPPVNSDYMDPDIIQNFIDSGFSLGFHGHQHRPQYLDTRFRHGPNRRIQIISAGTLCGGAAFGHRRAYNIVEFDTESKVGRLHLREMQNDNLQMPIWGPRALSPNRVSYIDFSFDAPPVPIMKADRVTAELGNAQALFEKNMIKEAIVLLVPLVAHDDLARRLLLECYLKSHNYKDVISTFISPKSAAEAIALMDAFWQQADRAGLLNLLNTNVIADAKDASVIELRNKYIARLSK